jgi:hypothetical protein
LNSKIHIYDIAAGFSRIRENSNERYLEIFTGRRDNKNNN